MNRCDPASAPSSASSRRASGSSDYSHSHSHGGCSHDHDHGGCSHDHDHGGHNSGGPSSHTHSHKETKNVLNRMSRIIGHMNAVKTMVEYGRDCSEVLIQLSAIDSAIKSLSRVILKDHLSTCIVEAAKNGDETAIEELNRAIDKFMK